MKILCFFPFWFSLTCWSGIIYYLGFSPCLQARTTFKPIQTLQILKITLCLPLPGLAEAFFKQEIRLFLPARLLLNSPRDLVVLFQTTRWQGHCIVCVCVCVCLWWGGEAVGRVLFLPSIAKGPDIQCGKLTSLKAKQSSWPFVNSHSFCGLIFLSLLLFSCSVGSVSLWPHGPSYCS